jgi:uncharacterized protein (UPF0128 family)
LLAVDGWRVDVAESVLLKFCRNTSKVSTVKLSNVSENILQELRGSQSATEILKSRGFSRVAFVYLGVVSSFEQLEKIFKYWCRPLMVYVDIGLFILSL